MVMATQEKIPAIVAALRKTAGPASHPAEYEIEGQ
jgi:hypothetical protein